MRLSRNKPQYPPRMISSFLKLFRSNLAVYLSGERILIGSQAGLLAKESTCVALHAATRRVLAVGSEAQKMKGKEPGNITVVQPFQGGAIHDFDIAEAAFRYFLKKHAPRTLIAPRIVVCGQLKSETAKRALKDAFTHAGAREILLLETSMAKACAPTLLRIREAFKEMLEQLPKEKRSLVANATIHLTGDYSSVPGLAQLLEKRIQRSFKVSPKSDEAAYHGTASILQELNELLPYVSSKGQ